MQQPALTAALPAPRTRPVLRALASLKLTVVAIGWLAAAVAWSFDTGASITWNLSGPMALMAANLAAAIATHPVLRRNFALLVFHVALIAIVLLIAASRLTYLRANVELGQGQVFEGAVVAREAGPWHPGGLEALRFVNEGFEIDYASERRRGETRNAVRWVDDAGRTHRAVIGDDTPLVLDGFRFYTSFNKGFAPHLRWTPEGGAPVRGTVNLPPYPVYEAVQATDWTPPGATRALSIALKIDEVLIDPERASRFRVPAGAPVEIGDGGGTVVTLRPGERATLAGGTLVYEGLGTWMGYTVHYDPAMPWLLAACVVACVSLGAYFLRRFAARPWNP